MWLGFVKWDKILTVYLFAPALKICTCPVNDLPVAQPPSFTRTQNHILETKSHFTPVLLICALGDLTVSKLTRTYLTASVHI
jgi:hypothetical protein